MENRLAALEMKFDINLRKALAFVTNLHAAYSDANPRLRRRINQAIFERFLISDEGDVIVELRPPFDLLLQASGTTQNGIIRARGDKETTRPAKGATWFE